MLLLSALMFDPFSLNLFTLGPFMLHRLPVECIQRCGLLKEYVFHVRVSPVVRRITYNSDVSRVAHPVPLVCFLPSPHSTLEPATY